MNRYSIKRQYSTPRTPFDMEFIGQAMAYKQSKVDANRSMIQQTIDDIVGLQIDKPESREYLNTRVEELLANINSYGSVDLSSDGITRNITSYINNAIDDTVINAYAGTMEGKRMEAYYDDLMRNDPDRYNERNKAFAMAPYYQWLQDGQAGSRLAPLQVSNYVDYKKEAEDVLKQMREARKNGMEVEYPDPNNPGYKIKKKINQMTEAEVQQALYNSLSPGAKKQMYIDGWYMSQTQPDLFTVEGLNGYVQSYNNDISRKKDALKAEMAGAISDENRYNELLASYNLLNSQVESFNNQARQIFSSGDKAQMGAFMVENNFMKGMGQTWAYSNSSINYDTDTAYWKRVEYERNVRNDQFDASYKRELLAIQRANAERQAALAKSQIEYNQARANKLNKENGSGGSGPIDIQNLGVVTNQVLDTKGSIRGGQEYIAAEIDRSRKAMKESVNNLMSSLKPENRREIQSWIAEKRASGDPKYSGLGDDDMIKTYFDENGKSTNTMLSYGDARNAYLNMKEVELSVKNQMKVIDGYTEYQNNTIDELSGMVGSPQASVALSLAGIVDKAFVYDYKTVQPEGVDPDLNNPRVSIIDTSYFDPEVIESPSMTAMLKTIGSQFGFNNLTSSDVFDEVDGKYVLKLDRNNPVVAMLGSIVDDEKEHHYDRSKGASFGGLLGQTIGAALPGVGQTIGQIAGSIIGENYVPSSSDRMIDRLGISRTQKDVVKSTVDKLYDSNEYNQIAEQTVIKTPVGYTIHNDDKIDSARRDAYNKLISLWDTTKGLREGKEPKSQEAIEKIASMQKNVTLTSIVDPESGELKYGIYVNGAPETMEVIDANTLRANGFPTEDSSSIPVENIPYTSGDVFYADYNDEDYARYVVGLTGLSSITSKYDMVNDMFDRNGDLFKQVVDPETGQYTLTGMGSEAEQMILGSDNFAVAIEGYRANSMSGLKIYLYDKNDPVESRQPVYQYTMRPETGNNAYRWLQVCPQYFFYEAMNNAIEQYRSTKMRGSEAGKAGWNKLMNVVLKNRKDNGQ